MQIDVYADVVCPWCYIGERRLEQALEQRPDVHVVRQWHPFQLQPQLPPDGLPWGAFAERKFGGLANMERAFAQVVAAGAADGIEFRFDRVASAPNTVDAHRLIGWAESHGKTWDLTNALFKAYFVDGHNLNDSEQLVDIATGVGLNGAEARILLVGDQGKERVEQSQRAAAKLGIQGVPFVVFDGRFAVSGAQPVSVFVRALDAAT